MSRVIVVREALQAIQGVQTPVQVCDVTNRVLGQFLPPDDYIRMQYELALAEPWDEDARRQGLEDYTAGRYVTTEQLLQEIEEIERSWEKKA